MSWAALFQNPARQGGGLRSKVWKPFYSLLQNPPPASHLPSMRSWCSATRSGPSGSPPHGRGHVNGAKGGESPGPKELPQLLNSAPPTNTQEGWVGREARWGSLAEFPPQGNRRHQPHMTDTSCDGEGGSCRQEFHLPGTNCLESVPHTAFLPSWLLAAENPCFCHLTLALWPCCNLGKSLVADSH